MILIDQSEINLILNARIRKRSLLLPYRYGEYGELRRAPRIGSVHTLRAPSEYANYREQAGRQPTRARAVLWLIDRCEPKRTAVITVLHVEPSKDGWLIQFARGDQSQKLDRPRLLKATISTSHYDDEHGYTHQPALALQREPEAISARLLDQYALEANARDLERRPPYTERDRQRRRRAKHRARVRATLALESSVEPSDGASHDLARLRE